MERIGEGWASGRLSTRLLLLRARWGEGFIEEAAPSDPEPRGGKGRDHREQDDHKGCRSQEMPPRFR